MTTWFLCKIQYIRQLENDRVKMISEEYLVDAVSFTDAETRIYRYISSSIKDFNIVSVRKTNFRDIYNYDDCETWYRCKMSYLSVDERSGKEKKINTFVLVSATNPKQAYDRLEDNLKTMIVPYDITDVNLTAIVDIIPYFPDDEEVPANLKPLNNNSSQDRAFVEQLSDIDGGEEEDYDEQFSDEADLEDEELADEELADEELADEELLETAPQAGSISGELADIGEDQAPEDAV